MNASKWMNLVAFSTVSMMMSPGASADAGAAVHVLQAGRYTLRASAMPSARLAASTARDHGIERAPELAVLNVVVLERRDDGAKVTVPALVNARKENLLGQSEAEPMFEVKENGRISDVGEFGFAPLRKLHFVLEVLPAGSDDGLRTDFEDRLVISAH